MPAMSERHNPPPTVDRRGFFKTASAGIAAAGLVLSPDHRLEAAAWSEKDKLARLAACSWPIRFIFKTRQGGGRGASGGGRGASTAAAPPPAAAAAGQPSTAPPPPTSRGNAGVSSQEMKERYGEITMLDFPQFTKDTFPGVTHMDIFSGLFGDVTDDSMFDGRHVRSVERSGRKWLDKLAAKMVDDRHEGPAHLEQRADEPGDRSRRRAAQGGRGDRARNGSRAARCSA